MLLCLYPPGSMRCPASVLPCPPAVPSTSFRVLTLSRPCPSLSTLRPALVLSALTAGAATALGSRLGARPTAPAARRGGALGVIGSAPDPAAARASPHHPRPAAIRPCSRPLSGPAAPPHPPPRFLFPAGSPGLSWRGPPRPAHTCPAPDGAGPPHARSHPRAPPPHTLSRPRAQQLSAPTTRRTPGCSRLPGALDRTSVRCAIHTRSAANRSYQLSQLWVQISHPGPQNTHFNLHGISTLPGATFLGITQVYFSGNSCRVWDRALRSRQNFHTCSSSGIIASQRWAGL